MNTLLIFLLLFIIIILLLLAQNVLCNSRKPTPYANVDQTKNNVDKVNFFYCFVNQLYETTFYHAITFVQTFFFKHLNAKKINER